MLFCHDLPFHERWHIPEAKNTSTTKDKQRIYEVLLASRPTQFLS